VQGRLAEAKARFDDLRQLRILAAKRSFSSSRGGDPTRRRGPGGERASGTAGAFEDPGLAGEAFVALATGGDVAAAGGSRRGSGKPGVKEFAPVDRGIIDALAAWAAGPGRRERELRAVAARSDVYVRYLGLVLLGQLATNRVTAAPGDALEDARGRLHPVAHEPVLDVPAPPADRLRVHERNGDLARGERTTSSCGRGSARTGTLPLLARRRRCASVSRQVGPRQSAVCTSATPPAPRALRHGGGAHRLPEQHHGGRHGHQRLDVEQRCDPRGLHRCRAPYQNR